MIEAASQALVTIFSPFHLLLLVAGVLMGLVIGALPGIGGLAGLAILLPFTYTLGPYAAIPLIIGMLAADFTGDSIPAILFSVPGSAGAAATVVDGYPMTKRGEAGRALGIAFSASALGGLFGALVLALSLPVLRPLVLMFGVAEYFMLTLMGISMLAAVGGKPVYKGFIAASLGLVLAMIGTDDQTGVLRWTFDQPFLLDGVPLVAVATGLFAIPELVDMGRSNIDAGSAAIDCRLYRGIWTGIKDTFRHWFLLIRCSSIGVWVGFLPGLGASAADWMAYGHAVQTEKGKENFGKGDPRGVVAAECANNACRAGDLIPTIAFGVPGSGSMALVLAAFTILGLVPGPAMLTKQLDVTFTIVWSLALANLAATGVCLVAAKWIAKASIVQAHRLVPLIIVFVFVGVFTLRYNIVDLVLLMVFGALGLVMKRLRYPRPALILAFVLGPLTAKYFFVSNQVHGAEWVTRPWVIILFLVTLVAVFAPGLMERRARKKK
ncbi:MAG: tripartite tricarboxylate transporter permease [Chloroflexi bacterium]|nr:tripartite tricarboxylate transporter permease [Chloroflexota bacterium]